MTLQRFLNGIGDWRWTWPGLSRWKPQVTQRFTVGPWLAHTLLGTLIGALPGIAFTALARQNPMMAGVWWPLILAMGLATVIAGFAFLLVAVAWNRRAARLNAAGLREAPAQPPLRWWQFLFVGPFYALLLFLATPLLLCSSVDHALAAWAWKRVQADLVARHEPLRLTELQSPAPSDDENLAMTPLLRASWDYRLEVVGGKTEFVWNDPTNRFRLQLVRVPQSFRPKGPSRGRATNDGRVNLDWIARSIRTEPPNLPEGLPEDLARRYGFSLTNQASRIIPDETRQRYGLKVTNTPPARNQPAPQALTEEKILALPIADPAGEVLAYLRRFDTELQELTTAAQRPRSRFGVHWEEGYSVLLPYLAEMKNLAVTYRIRAVARLAQGDTAGAFSDTLTNLRLADSLAEDPVLLSLLVRFAQTSIATSTAWQGMASHQWNEPQLAQLQAHFARIDFRDAIILAFRGERALSNGIYDAWLDRRQPVAAFVLDSPDPRGREADMFPALPPFAPRGIFRRNQINHHRVFDHFLAQLRDPAWPRTLVGAPSIEEELRQLGLRPVNPYTIMPAMLMPAFDKTQAKAARQNVTARLAEAACALERHRLKHGTYPPNLDALLPGYLKVVPLDPMNGQPLHYEREDNGWFRLWSVGLNGRDDDGTVIDNDQKGDWVWPVPIPSTEMRLF